MNETGWPLSLARQCICSGLRSAIASLYIPCICLRLLRIKSVVDIGHLLLLVCAPIYGAQGWVSSCLAHAESERGERHLAYSVDTLSIRGALYLMCVGNNV